MITIPNGCYAIMSIDKRFALYQSKDKKQLKILEVCKDYDDYELLVRKKKEGMGKFLDFIPNVEIVDWNKKSSPLGRNKVLNRELNLYVTDDMFGLLGSLASQKGKSKADFVRDILSDYLNPNRKEPISGTLEDKVEQEPTQSDKTARMAEKMRKIERLEDLWHISFEQMYENIDWEKVENGKI